MMRKMTMYRFDWIGFDGSPCTIYANWRYTIQQARARFKFIHRFHTIKNLEVSVWDGQS